MTGPLRRQRRCAAGRDSMRAGSRWQPIERSRRPPPPTSAARLRHAVAHRRPASPERSASSYAAPLAAPSIRSLNGSGWFLFRRTTGRDARRVAASATSPRSRRFRGRHCTRKTTRIAQVCFNGDFNFFNAPPGRVSIRARTPGTGRQAASRRGSQWRPRCGCATRTSSTGPSRTAHLILYRGCGIAVRIRYRRVALSYLSRRPRRSGVRLLRPW